MNNTQKTLPTRNGLDTATGIIDYGFTNDYMFRAILQKNKRVLKALICALLHLRPSEIQSIMITNPIELGENIDNKEFILDIHVNLNNDRIINLEMQVVNLLNWPERSLSYLCRTFNQLNKGEDYIEAKSAVHIGFLNFTLFPDHPEFYATYQLLNIKNHNLYTDKFTIGVVDLTHIELATGEDKSYGIDHWASLFKSTTWEEIRMIAEKNDELREASEELYTLNADDIARQKSQARKDYYQLHHTINRKLNELTAEAERLASENETLASENETLASENETLASENETLASENQQLKSLLEQYHIPYPSQVE